MASTYTPIATQTLGSAASSVTFSSIPGTYTDLVLVMDSQLTGGSGTAWLQFNGDTATNYSDTFLTGNGTTASSTRNSTSANLFFGEALSTTRTMQVVHIANYFSANTTKPIIARSNGATSAVNIVVGLWRATPAAITSILVSQNAGNTFIAGSTFTLYGIKAA